LLEFQYDASVIRKNIILAGDAHFHLYPCFDFARIFSELIRNLDALVDVRVGQRTPSVPSDRNHETFRLAFLVENVKCDYFHDMAGKQFGDFQIVQGTEANCLNVNKDGKAQLCLVASRQIVTMEKLEVLSLGMEEKIADGLPAGEIIEKILAAGGIPVLPFSPGKWLFKRGRLAKSLVTKYGQKLVAGDSALRPVGWGRPEIMRMAGGRILPGSDPLPLPGEEKYAGQYGFVCQGMFDVSKPFTAIKEIVLNKPDTILAAGRRCSMLNVAGRLFRLKKLKKRPIDI